MGKTILYLFFAALLSATLAFLVMIFGPVLYVEAMRFSKAVPNNVRVAAYCSLLMFVSIVAMASLAIPARVLSPVKSACFFIVLPIVITWIMPTLGFTYLTTLVVLAVLAVPVFYQVMASRQKATA